MPKPSLGICILNWNSGSHLVACIRSVLDSLCDGAELLVVDNNSSDDSISQLRSVFPEVSIAQNSANLGYACGNNVGARALIELGCEYLLFVNPDVTVTNSTISEMMESIKAHPDTACIGGPSVRPDGTIRSGCRRRPRVWQKLVLYSPLLRGRRWARRRLHTHYYDYNSIKDGAPVYAITGACVLFRANAFEQMGGFDENTFLYEEEFIVAERLRKLNWKTRYRRAAMYGHYGSHSTGSVPLRSFAHFIRSEYHLLRQYYQWPLLACIGVFVFRWAEWLVYAFYWVTIGGRRARLKAFRECSSVKGESG